MTSSHALITGVLSTASSSNSSSLPSQWNYDVFLSFRGEDTRNGFTGHLYHALDQKGINTYKDDVELRRGEEISPALLKAIEESKISIVVFSENYASSTWCLDELIKILECKESKQQKVLPVFYKVEPSTIRHQLESFKDAFDKHKDRFKDDAKVQRWKTALKQVADLSGFDLKMEENESEFIQKIVQEVSSILPNHTCLHVAKYPVGLESRVEDIINKLLRIEIINETRMIGIFGTGGIGKTTIAKEVYNRITYQFEGSCFLANVRENSKPDKGGLAKLQKKILSDILRNPKVEVDDVDRGINMIQEKLCRKKVLLILDDIDCLDQLEKLSGRSDWFGLGSRIIITTRDEHLLVQHDVGNWKYPMNELDLKDALKLFSWHAFKCDKPEDGFVELTELALQYAGGLPLALTVVGSNLLGRDIHYWKSEMKEYKRIPEQNIHEKLKISYDGLDSRTKKIFLDIACFFKGYTREYVTKILDSCGFNAYAGIKKLNDKCLITITPYDRLEMHDLLQDMGREIVRQESPEEPGKRSRLYFHEDVRVVLERNKGTEQIEGILINPPQEDNCMIRLDSEVFAKMEKLRILIVRSYKDNFCGGLNYLSNELRVIDWPYCFLEFLPSNFHGEKLIDLTMSRSMIRDLGMRLLSKNLTSIDLGYCEYLTKISDLSSCLNLEVLFLRGCGSLVEVHDSVGFLDKLVELDFGNCSSLKKLPRSFELISLKLLELEGCTSLEYFPEIKCEMKHLEYLNIESTVILDLPSSITYLTGLETLYICKCDSLVHFPVNIFQLEHLQDVSIICCSSLKKFFPESNNLSRKYNFSSSLKTLNLYGSDIVSLSPCIEGFVGLSKLDLTNCKQLEEILYLPPNIEEVNAEGCSSLKNFLPESNNLSRTYNFSSSLRTLNLSFSDIVSLSPCIEGFVGLSKLDLTCCSQLEEILYLPPNIEEVNAGRCFSLKNFFPESNNLSRTYNFSSSLRTLNLSFSDIVSLSPCIEGFVGLSKLDLTSCAQLEEILYLPPNIEEVNAGRCFSLKNFFPKSNNLSRTYNFSSSLRTLNLSGSDIVSLSPCIEGFVGLLKLDLSDCKQLEEILYLPPNIEEVNAGGCFSLKNFLPESNNLSRTYNFSSSLKTLILRDSGIVSLSPCIEGFVGLSKLDLTSCSQLEEILYLPPNIEEVNAGRCFSLKNFFPKSNNLSRTYNFLSSLKTLILRDSGIVSLSPCIEGFVGLSKLDLTCCSQLEEILYLPPNIEEVNAGGCFSLKNFLPESNNLSRTYNFSSSLKTLILRDSGIVSLSPCIEGFVGLSKLDLTSCSQLEEILYLPPNIEEVKAVGCVLLERFPHVSTESSFGTPDLKRLTWINLLKCNKVEVNVGNHAPDPLLVQERFREKKSSTIIYLGSRIPEWFKYCKETTSLSKSIEIEIDHNASMCFGHQIMALVLCFVMGPFPALTFYDFNISINGQQIGNDGTRSLDSMDRPNHVCLKYIAGNSIDDMLSRSHREGNNNIMRFTFESNMEKPILKSVGVHIICGNDNFINPIQLSKRYRDDGEHDLEPDWNPQQKRQSSTTRIMEFKDANDDLIIEDLDLELGLGN